ncbi:phosphoserine phosphatase SerB [Alteromonas sp. a30]|nr:phosphoserine phosphatase SerB [Alteromonas sp. a30]
MLSSLSFPLPLSEAQYFDTCFAHLLADESICFRFTTVPPSSNLVLNKTEIEHKTQACIVVSCEALNIEKLHQVEQALAQTLAFQSWLISVSRSAKSNRLVAKAKVELLNKQERFSSVNVLLEEVSQELQVEVAFVESAPILSEPGLLVMDMDSTVINIECIDEIAKLAGVGDKVSEVTELAMQGKLDFAQSLTSRVACLQHAEERLLKTVRDKLPLMPGIENLVTTLKHHGWRLAIASGGFTYFANYLKQRLGLDYAISNELEIVDAKLTGKVLGNIVDAQVKAQTVESLAQQFSIPMSQTVALGDGANDLVMMQKAALGVAYKAKPIVREQSQTSIRFGELDQLLDYLR